MSLNHDKRNKASKGKSNNTDKHPAKFEFIFFKVLYSEIDIF